MEEWFVRASRPGVKRTLLSQIHVELERRSLRGNYLLVRFFVVERRCGLKQVNVVHCWAAEERIIRVVS